MDKPYILVEYSTHKLDEKGNVVNKLSSPTTVKRKIFQFDNNKFKFKRDNLKD